MEQLATCVEKGLYDKDGIAAWNAVEKKIGGFFTPINTDIDLLTKQINSCLNVLRAEKNRLSSSNDETAEGKVRFLDEQVSSFESAKIKIIGGLISTRKAHEQVMELARCGAEKAAVLGLHRVTGVLGFLVRVCKLLFGLEINIAAKSQKRYNAAIGFWRNPDSNEQAESQTSQSRLAAA